LTIKLIGKNTITSADSKNYSHAIFARNLKIVGPGELIANYGTSENGSSSIVFDDELIIKGATVIAKGSSSSIEESIGISSEMGILKIEDGSRVCIQGSLFALEPSLDLSNYSNPIVEVDTEYDGLNKKEIDAPYPDFAYSEYKYVCIRPEGSTPTPSGTYLPTGNMNWNLFGPPVVSEPAQDIIIKEKVISFTEGESEYVLNRTKIAMDGTPYIKSDRIMLPLRYVAEAMDMKVEYDNGTRVATFKDDKKTITINIDTGIMTLDGKEYPLEVKPEITNDRIYLPLGLIADALGMTRENPQSGYDISWYQNTKTATITIKK
ncbi:MAG: copper amine oxidase N-terminal domain-containing protein, partial [Tissierellia bacterium]|nr:copper amine oxidase N-terminal domain-containing protein [Tissierellia bacterium]